MRLPSSKSISNWTSCINGEPGFFKEVFEALNRLNPDDKHCCLMLDAMSIKKQIVWDERLGKFIGNTDYGNAVEVEGTDTCTTESLVFMLVSINGRWKLPIGYVFINKLTAVTQAELIKLALIHAYNAGLTVYSVTCDGAYTNFSTFKLLGCLAGDNYDDIKCWFDHPITKSKVFYIPDACHMLKLARNTLANNYVLESDDGFIKWDHIKNLFEIQKEVTLKLGNKLSNAHINFQNNKMKVKYAAQTLSSSTADSLYYLQNTKFPSFDHVTETIKFCRIIDRIFDFLNSKSKFSNKFKAPIFRNNIDQIEEIIVPLVKYLYTLKFKNSFLFLSNKKTFILGFAFAVKSVISLSKMLFIQNPTFNYILTYKFSQDHLELLFGRIRQRFGSNNNPNVLQFKTAIKQILIKNSLKCQSNFNCNTFDDDPVGSLFEIKWRKKSNKENIYDADIADEFEIDAQKNMQLLNIHNNTSQVRSHIQDVKSNILYYIGGYIVRKLDLNCNSCKIALLKQSNEHDYCKSVSFSKFVNLKNKGGLVSVSNSVFTIIQEAEKMFLFLTNNLQSLHKPNLDITIIYHVINMYSFDKRIFPDLNCDNVCLLERPHKLVLITLITKKFIRLRLKSFGKMYSSDYLNPISKRHKLSKIILFSNQ